MENLLLRTPREKGATGKTTEFRTLYFREPDATGKEKTAGRESARPFLHGKPPYWPAGCFSSLLVSALPDESVDELALLSVVVGAGVVVLGVVGAGVSGACARAGTAAVTRAAAMAAERMVFMRYSSLDRVTRDVDESAA